MSLTDEFDKSITRFVDQDRQAIYGHPEQNFRRIAALQAITAECADPELKVALDNIVLKVARLIQTPSHTDSWVDVAGYARCATMILDRRAERES